MLYQKSSKEEEEREDGGSFNINQSYNFSDHDEEEHEEEFHTEIKKLTEEDLKKLNFDLKL